MSKININLFSFGIYNKYVDISIEELSNDPIIYDIHKIHVKDFKLPKDVYGTDKKFKIMLFKNLEFQEEYDKIKEDVINKINKKFTDKLDIIICCSYGWHRSVAFVEKLYFQLKKEMNNITLSKQHPFIDNMRYYNL